jgi:hypothetical protein
VCVHIDAKANNTSGAKYIDRRNIYKKKEKVAFIISTSHTYTHTLKPKHTRGEEDGWIDGLDWTPAEACAAAPVCNVLCCLQASSLYIYYNSSCNIIYFPPAAAVLLVLCLAISAAIRWRRVSYLLSCPLFFIWIVVVN